MSVSIEAILNKQKISADTSCVDEAVESELPINPVMLEVLDTAKLQHIPGGSHLLTESDCCQSFMWLLEGRIRIFKNSAQGREITLYRVNPGETCILSLQHLLSGEAFSAEAVAETDISFLALSRAEFLTAIDDSKSFRFYILNFLSQRIGSVVKLVSEVTFERLDLRLAGLLGQLFERSGGMPLSLTHAQLASELGSTREVISRILKEFEYQKYIKLARGQIDLVSSEGLSWFSR
ncbi:transcriptional regulator, Crp/Fnr family [hydrothermal vent metagenome]|uniref:Transcriptional regulator, Crp/Fnr family n=1 Tax=hydrothermal vent metagenome TaxID=652676 RepID=A0A3B0WJ77_9ZZZZ